jgi:hypothetical protein
MLRNEDYLKKRFKSCTIIIVNNFADKEFVSSSSAANVVFAASMMYLTARWISTISAYSLQQFYSIRDHFTQLKWLYAL